MAQMGDTVITGSLAVTNCIYGSVTCATNSTCFNGKDYATACADIRSGLTTCVGTVTIANKASDSCSTPIALCSGATTVGKSNGCGLTFVTCTGTLTTTKFVSTSLCLTSFRAGGNCTCSNTIYSAFNNYIHCNYGYNYAFCNYMLENHKNNYGYRNRILENYGCDIGFCNDVCNYAHNASSTAIRSDIVRLSTLADNCITCAENFCMYASGSYATDCITLCGTCNAYHKITVNSNDFIFCCDGYLHGNVCGTIVRTPTLMSNATSGKNANNNVTIRACCTNDSCALCCRNFIFCGSTGYMHGNVCGNLCGQSACTYSVSRTAITTGEFPVLLAGGCTTTTTGGLCVAGASACQLKYNVATGVLTATKFCGAFDGSQADIKCISNCCTGTAKSYICVWADCGTSASYVYCSNSTICSIGNDESCNLISSCSFYNAKNSICSVSSRGSHVLLCSCGIHSTDGYADMSLSVTGSNNGNLILQVYNNNRYTTYACLQNACICLIGCDGCCSTNCKTTSYINLFTKETDLCSKCAIDSNKFGGCTFSQACTAIRSGLLSLSISGHTITFA